MAKETIEEYQKRVAKAGGAKIVEKYGPRYMKKLGKKGLDKRWNKKSKLKKLLFD